MFSCAEWSCYSARNRTVKHSRYASYTHGLFGGGQPFVKDAEFRAGVGRVIHTISSA